MSPSGKLPICRLHIVCFLRFSAVAETITSYFRGRTRAQDTEWVSNTLVGKPGLWKNMLHHHYTSRTSPQVLCCWKKESMKMPAVDGKRCKYTWVNVRIATNKSIRLRPYAQHIVSTLTLPTRCFHADSSDYPCLKKLFGSPSCLPRNVRNRWQFHQEMVEWNKTATIAKWWIVGDRRLARTNMQNNCLFTTINKEETPQQCCSCSWDVVNFFLWNWLFVSCFL